MPGILSMGRQKNIEKLKGLYNQEITRIASSMTLLRKEIELNKKH